MTSIKQRAMGLPELGKYGVLLEKIHKIEAIILQWISGMITTRCLSVCFTDMKLFLIRIASISEVTVATNLVLISTLLLLDTTTVQNHLRSVIHDYNRKLVKILPN